MAITVNVDPIAVDKDTVKDALDDCDVVESTSFRGFRGVSYTVTLNSEEELDELREFLESQFGEALCENTEDKTKEETDYVISILN